MSDRPTKPTEEMKLTAAREIAEELRSAGHLDANEVEDSAKDIAKHGSTWGDGYKLAQSLDDRGWDCNLDMAEILDGYSSAVRTQIEAAEKQWAADNNIQPPDLIDRPVKLKSGETGIVTGVYGHGVAKFLVKIDGDKEANGPSQSRRIINFEDAIPVAP